MERMCPPILKKLVWCVDVQQGLQGVSVRSGQGCPDGSRWFYSRPSGGWWYLSDNMYGKGQKQGECVRKSERNSPASAELGG